MKTFFKGCLRTGLTFKLLSILIFSLLMPVLTAQKAVDFSGVWVQDTAKSDDFYKAFLVTVTIKQDAQKISVSISYGDYNGGGEATVTENTFTLDGKEILKKDENGEINLSAKWSADKKSLTTKATRTYGPDVVGNTITYSLSSDGKTLTSISADIHPGGLKVKQVLVRKR
jgi:hypothetical protein